jgi:hypothetical protein
MARAPVGNQRERQGAAAAIDYLTANDNLGTT